MPESCWPDCIRHTRNNGSLTVGSFSTRWIFHFSRVDLIASSCCKLEISFCKSIISILRKRLSSKRSQIEKLKVKYKEAIKNSSSLLYESQNTVHTAQNIVITLPQYQCNVTTMFCAVWVVQIYWNNRLQKLYIPLRAFPCSPLIMYKYFGLSGKAIVTNSAATHSGEKDANMMCHDSRVPRTVFNPAI